jgi:hypothetical protein
MLPPARARVLAAALSLVPLAALVSRDARAQDASAPSRGDGVVELTIAGADDDTALRDSIRELLSRLDLTVVAPGAPGVKPSSRIASVQIDLTSRTDALVLVTDAATGEVRLRRSVPRDTTAAIVREEIAHAVQSAVEAALLAARDRASQPPAPAPPAAPPPPPVVVALPPPVAKEQPPAGPARPAPLGLELATLAGVGPVADGAGPVSRIGLGASAVSRAFLRPSLGLSFLFAVPFDTDTPHLSAHTTIFSIRALPAVGLFRGSWLAVDLGAGAGVDIISVAPHSSDLPSNDVNDQATRVDAIVSSMLSAHAAVAPGVTFLLSAGVDVDLDSRQYVFAQGPTNSDVLAPWQVRPMILIGVGFTALGDGFLPSGGGR